MRPSWVDAPVPPGMVEIVLDPGMAFGTGTHPTTSLCLAALSDLLAARPGASVLDVGTGSGLLAIAAAKLGAGRVAANDNDPVAVEVARENAERNGAMLELTGAAVGRDRRARSTSSSRTSSRTRSSSSRRTSPRAWRRAATVLLAGILVPQEDEVRAAYVAEGLRPTLERRDGEWSLLALERPRA